MGAGAIGIALAVQGIAGAPVYGHLLHLGNGDGEHPLALGVDRIVLLHAAAADIGPRGDGQGAAHDRAVVGIVTIVEVHVAAVDDDGPDGDHIGTASGDLHHAAVDGQGAAGAADSAADGRVVSALHHQLAGLVRAAPDLYALVIGGEFEAVPDGQRGTVQQNEVHLAAARDLQGPGVPARVHLVDGDIAPYHIPIAAHHRYIFEYPG